MKKHVFLVENDSSDLKVFVEALDRTKIDYKCTWAQTGKQALDQLQYLLPDFIFIKRHLPDTDSAKLLSTIRRNPKLANTRVATYTHPHEIRAAMIGTPIATRSKEAAHPSL